MVQETNWAFMSGSCFKLFKEFILKKIVSLNVRHKERVYFDLM